jgi:hypothetical protein
MPLSSKLAPGFVRYTYSGTVNPHHGIICVNFPEEPSPGVEPDVILKDTTTLNIGAALLQYAVDAWAEQFPNTVRMGLYDVYKVDSETGVRTWVWAGNVNTVGGSVETQVPFSEGVWVFKSDVGKPIKVYTMESVYAPDVRNVGTVPADGRQAMIDYMLSGDSMFYGQTNGYALAFATFTSKINDVLRRNGGFVDV